LKLMSTGRFSYTPEKIHAREELARMFEAVDRLPAATSSPKSNGHSTKGAH